MQQEPDDDDVLGLPTVEAGPGHAVILITPPIGALAYEAVVKCCLAAADQIVGAAAALVNQANAIYADAVQLADAVRGEAVGLSESIEAFTAQAAALHAQFSAERQRLDRGAAAAGHKQNGNGAHVAS